MAFRGLFGFGALVLISGYLGLGFADFVVLCLIVWRFCCVWVLRAEFDVWGLA